MTGDCPFDEWVCRRLAEWPATRILDFERWLEEQDAFEFVPAVHEALVRRGIKLEDADRQSGLRTA